MTSDPITLTPHMADQVTETAKVLEITPSELAEICIEIVLGQSILRALLRGEAEKRNRPGLTVLKGGAS
jgi:hypothetical protein